MAATVVRLALFAALPALIIGGVVGDTSTMLLQSLYLEGYFPLITSGLAAETYGMRIQTGLGLGCWTRTLCSPIFFSRNLMG